MGMSCAQVAPLYAVRSGSTVTFVGPMALETAYAMNRTLHGGEKLFTVKSIDFSYKQLFEIASFEKNFSSKSSVIDFPDSLNINDPIISCGNLTDCYCIEYKGVMQVLGYCSEDIARLIAQHFHTEYYKFDPNPQHIDLGDNFGTYDLINEILRLYLNGSTQSNREETTNIRKKTKNKKNDYDPNAVKKTIVPTKSEIRMINDFQRRCRVLDLIRDDDIVGHGYSQRTMAKMTNASVGLVNKIMALYRENPNLTYDDLGEKPRGPKPNPYSKITKDEFDELVEVLQTKGPMDVGIESCAWKAADVITYLEQKNIHVSLSYFYKFCQKVGLTSKAATRKNPRQDDKKVDFFVTEGFREIAKLALEENREVVSVDEMGLMVDHKLRGYSLRNTPTICSYDPSMEHSTHSICTFIGLNGFFRTFIYEGSLTTEGFIEFLEIIKEKYKGKKFLFIMDNAKIHASKEAYNWYLENEKFCLVRFLPPYAPKLNVVEFFNNLFKQDLRTNCTTQKNSIVERAYLLCDKYNAKGSVEIAKINSLFSKKECSYIKKIYDEVYNELKLNSAANA